MTLFTFEVQIIEKVISILLPVVSSPHPLKIIIAFSYRSAHIAIIINIVYPFRRPKDTKRIGRANHVVGGICGRSGWKHWKLLEKRRCACADSSFIGIRL